MLLHVERPTDDTAHAVLQEAYCRLLSRYKEELSRPFDEAASFLTTIRSQLTTLCGGGGGGATSPHYSGN